jgi:uncharacterized protein involved in tolerance to divalent cations
MYEIIETTTNNFKIAEKIANSLIKNKYSKCIQILKNEKSIYEWINSIQSAEEYLLRIKVNSKFKNDVVELISNKTNYKVPEIISYKIDILNKEYGEWLDN